MIHRLIALCITLFAGTAIGMPLITDSDKAIYGVGVSLAGQLEALQLSPAELKILLQGIQDAHAGVPLAIKMEEHGPRMKTLIKERAGRVAGTNEAAGKAFREKAAKEKGAVTTDSGLVYTELRAGKGPKPSATSKVKVHYRGTLIDGTEFDSSYARGEPISFPLNGVVACWTEGVQRMSVGSKARLVCPAKIAYGDRGAPPKIGPGATLVFEVELLAIE